MLYKNQYSDIIVPNQHIIKTNISEYTLITNTQQNKQYVLKEFRPKGISANDNHSYTKTVKELLELKNEYLMKYFWGDLGKRESFLCMEYIPDKSIIDYLSTNKCSVQEIIYVMYDVLQGLNYLHSTKKMIHTNIHPRNIFIKKDSSGQLNGCLGDIGVIDSTPSKIDPSYADYFGINPKDDEPVSMQQDIYDFGLCLYQLLTKEKDINFKSKSNTRALRLDNIRNKNPLVGKELVAIYEKIVATDLDKRYQSTEELLSVFELYIMSKMNTDLQDAKDNISRMDIRTFWLKKQQPKISAKVREGLIETREDKFQAGIYYLDPSKTSQENREAIKLIFSSSSDGSPDALLSMAHCQMYGIGTIISLEASKSYCLRYLNYEEHFSIHMMLGGMYLCGAGTYQDYELARLSYEKSLELEKNTQAYLGLAEIYKKGLGVERDIATAEKFLKYAQELDPNISVQQFTSTAIYHGVNTRAERFFRFYAEKELLEYSFNYALQGAKKGNQASLYNLGYHYEHGFITEQSYEQAINYYFQAIEETKSADAMCALASLYKKLYIRLNQIAPLYQKAYDSGSSQAAFQLATLYHTRNEEILEFIDDSLENESLSFIRRDDYERKARAYYEKSSSVLDSKLFNTIRYQQWVKRGYTHSLTTRFYVTEYMCQELVDQGSVHGICYLALIATEVDSIEEYNKRINNKDSEKQLPAPQTNLILDSFIKAANKGLPQAMEYLHHYYHNNTHICETHKEKAAYWKRRFETTDAEAYALPELLQSIIEDPISEEIRIFLNMLQYRKK